jgi:hypothetical protein
MAKPTTYATPICLVLTLFAAAGVFIGFTQKNPLWIILLLLPAVVYEVYRTEGESTKWSSWMLLLLLIAEAVCVIFKLNFNLATYLGQESTYVGMSYVPLGDIKAVFPTLMAVLAVILFLRTAGVYTKWLAVIIFGAMIATVYLISPNGLQELIRSLIQTFSWQMY